MFALGPLFGIIAVSLLVTRVATVVLTATGLSHEEARFQARSALTGTGFTTREAEAVVSHPLRRRVVMALMLMGNAGVVGAASSIIIGFRGGRQDGWRVLELAVGLMALVWISRSRWIDRRLTRLIARVLRRWTDLPSRDEATLLALSGDWAVAELRVRDGDWLAEQAIADLRLDEECVRVLGVTRADGAYEGEPDGDTVIHAGDLLILYGREPVIRELDDRLASETAAPAEPTRVRS